MKPEHEKFMGARVKDTVTGASGIVTCVSYYLNGCVRVMVEPPIDKDSKRPDAFYLDYQQVVIEQENATGDRVKSRTGGPQRGEAQR